METRSNDLTVESALEELRELFGRHVEIRVIDCVAPGCVAYRYEIEVRHLHRRAHAPSLSECLAQVRAWKAQQ